jgi:phosphoribosyl 1,2-cyclic phosphodiesterase
VRPEKCYLTHLSITMDHDTVRRQLPEGADVAWDGLEIIV